MGVDDPEELPLRVQSRPLHKHSDGERFARRQQWRSAGAPRRRGMGRLPPLVDRDIQQDELTGPRGRMFPGRSSLVARESVDRMLSSGDRPSPP